MSSFKTIDLPGFLREQSLDGDNITLAEGVKGVEDKRQREGKMRSMLSDKIVRRLDKGFARSNTVHPDTGQALFAICRALRPEIVFETGTYWGYSTAYLAAAVRDNELGKVHTFDLDANAGQHFPSDLRGYVEFYLGKPSSESMPAVLDRGVPQLFFQDSRHDYEGVCEELSLVAPRMLPGAIIIFPDFVAPEVRNAAHDILSADFSVRFLASGDPQQVGLAVKTG